MAIHEFTSSLSRYFAATGRSGSAGPRAGRSLVTAPAPGSARAGQARTRYARPAALAERGPPRRAGLRGTPPGQRGLVSCDVPGVRPAVQRLGKCRSVCANLWQSSQSFPPNARSAATN